MSDKMKEPGVLTLDICGGNGNTYSARGEGELFDHGSYLRYEVSILSHIVDTGWTLREIPGTFIRDSGRAFAARFRLLPGWRSEADLQRLTFEVVGAVTELQPPTTGEHLSPEEITEALKAGYPVKRCELGGFLLPEEFNECAAALRERSQAIPLPTEEERAELLAELKKTGSGPIRFEVVHRLFPAIPASQEWLADAVNGPTGYNIVSEEFRKAFRHPEDKPEPDAVIEGKP